MFFKQIEGEAAILASGGVYRQAEIYERNGYLFAKFGSGFVRLCADGSTSKAKMRLEAISSDGDLCRDSLGRLCRPTVDGAKKIDSELQQKMLEG